MTGHLRDGRIKFCGVGESRVVVLVKNLKQLTFAAAFHPHDVVRDVGYPVDHCELRDRVNQTTAAAVGPGVFVHAKKCAGAPLRCPFTGGSDLRRCAAIRCTEITEPLVITGYWPVPREWTPAQVRSGTGWHRS